MSYQPIILSNDFFIEINKKDTDVEKIYKSLELNNVERNCIDRLVLIIDDIRKSFSQKPTVLDLGCSGGFFSIGLAGSCAENVTGVDDDRYIKIQGETTLSSIKETKKRAEILNIQNVSFINSSIEDLVCKYKSINKAFDAVLCLNIVHHFYKGYGNLTNEGKLESDKYLDIIACIGEVTKKALYFETDASFYENYEKALLEIIHYGNFKELIYLGSSPAANGELRILWKFVK